MHIYKLIVKLFLVQDLFTSFTISLRKLHVEEEPYCNLKTFTHYGLFMAANVLRNSLVDHDILTKAFQKFPVHNCKHKYLCIQYPGCYITSSYQYTI